MRRPQLMIVPASGQAPASTPAPAPVPVPAPSSAVVADHPSPHQTHSTDPSAAGPLSSRFPAISPCSAPTAHLQAGRRLRSRPVPPLGPTSSASLAGGAPSEERVPDLKQALADGEQPRRSGRKRKLVADRDGFITLTAAVMSMAAGYNAKPKDVKKSRKRRKTKQCSKVDAAPAPLPYLTICSSPSSTFTFSVDPQSASVHYSFLPSSPCTSPPYRFLPPSFLHRPPPSSASLTGFRRPPLSHSFSLPNLPSHSNATTGPPYLSVPAAPPPHHSHQEHRPPVIPTGPSPSPLLPHFGLPAPPILPPLPLTKTKPGGRRRAMAAIEALGPLERSKKRKLAHRCIRSLLLLAGPWAGSRKQPVRTAWECSPANPARSEAQVITEKLTKKPYSPPLTATDHRPKWMSTPAAVEGRTSHLCPGEAARVGTGAGWLSALDPFCCFADEPALPVHGKGKTRDADADVRLDRAGAPLGSVPFSPADYPPNGRGMPPSPAGPPIGGGNQQAPLKAQLLAVLRMRAGTGPGDPSMRFKKWVLWNAWMRREMQGHPPNPSSPASANGAAPLSPALGPAPGVQVYDENGDPVPIQANPAALAARSPPGRRADGGRFGHGRLDAGDEGEKGHSGRNGSLGAEAEFGGGAGKVAASDGSRSSAEPSTPPPTPDLSRRDAEPAAHRQGEAPPTPTSPVTALPTAPFGPRSGRLNRPVLHAPRPKLARAATVPARLEGLAVLPAGVDVEAKEEEDGIKKAQEGKGTPPTPPPSPPNESPKKKKNGNSTRGNRSRAGGGKVVQQARAVEATLVIGGAKVECSA